MCFFKCRNRVKIERKGNKNPTKNEREKKYAEKWKKQPRKIKETARRVKKKLKKTVEENRINFGFFFLSIEK